MNILVFSPHTPMTRIVTLLTVNITSRDVWVCYISLTISFGRGQISGIRSQSVLNFSFFLSYFIHDIKIYR